MSEPSHREAALKSRPQLRESEALFRLFVDSVRDYAMFVLDPDGIVTSWNTGAERIKGYEVDEIVGQHFSKFYPQVDIDDGKCERELLAAARDGRFEDEGWRLRKDGSKFWANVIITALRDGNGALIGFAKVTRDLTERRRAEEERIRIVALEEANRLKDEFLALESAARRVADEARMSMSAMIRSIGEAVVVADDQGRVTLMNPAAERLTGVWLSVALRQPARHVLRLIDEETRVALENPIERVLGNSDSVESTRPALLIREDGREVPVTDTTTVIRDESGAVRGVIVVLRNVTAERRERLREAFLADATSLLTATFDYRRALEQVGELAVARFADFCAIDLFESSEHTTRLVTMCSLRSQPAQVQNFESVTRELVPRVVRTGSSEFPRVPGDASGLVGATESTTESVAPLLVVPITNGPRVLGALTLALGASGRFFEAQDLAAAEELGWRIGSAIQNARGYLAEQHAREAADITNRAKDNFLATISHELRTPLNSVLGWSQILSRPDLDPAKRERARATIERNARAMDRLIEDLLDVSRIIAGKLRLELRETDLGSIVEQAIDTLKPAAEARDIGVRYQQVDQDPVVVFGDAARLLQVVSNLVNNALKFTSMGGQVKVSLSSRDGFAELKVIDDGQGIDPAFVPRLFDPFRQANSSGTRSSRGLGLGLAISRNLVQAHAGSIEVYSEGLGRGATFTVRLPLPAREVDDDPSRDQPWATEGITELDGLKVLVVEDDEDARELVRAVLEEAGAKVTTSGSVVSALAAFEESKPDVLVSDIGLPDESGYDLVRKLRALPPERGGDIPAAALSAYTRPEDRQEALSAGFMLHAAKPINPLQLVSLVAHLARARVKGDSAST
jgi:PAS domain S-box-containing protein